jgi:hypothetical protein
MLESHTDRHAVTHPSTPRTPPSPLPARVVRASKRFSYALVAAVAFTFFPLPWALAGLPCAIAAGVLGVLVLRSLRGVPAVGLVALTYAGIALAGVMTATYAAVIVAYDDVLAYQRCVGGALTITAEDRCLREFEDAVSGRWGGWWPGAPGDD